MKRIGENHRGVREAMVLRIMSRQAPRKRDWSEEACRPALRAKSGPAMR